MNSKYKVTKFKKNRLENTEDFISIEEPLEISLKYKDNEKFISRSLSITMRTPGNDEDLVRGFLFNEQIIENIKDKIPEIYNDISSLELEYMNGWGDDNFESVFNKNQSKDRRLGYTSTGTHRSDFIVLSLGKPVRESGSMSTLVLACLILNLAKINVFHVKNGFKPVLLIDDLFFGIDNKNLGTVVKLLVLSKGNIVLTAPNIYKNILEKICEDNQELKLIGVGENG